jgi:hypothetical protein
MKVILDMPDIPYDSTQGEIVRDWINELKGSSEIVTPLRYVKTVNFIKEGEAA